MQTQNEKLPSDFSHKLHERLRETSHKLRKLLIGLSTGGVALIFATFTEKIDPALSYHEKLVLICGMASFALSLLAGLIAWKFDSQKNYFWAHELNAEDEIKEMNHRCEKDKFRKMERLSVQVLILCFGIGVVSLAIYTLFRLNIS